MLKMKGSPVATYPMVDDENGYVLCRLDDGKVALLDTGSPFTLSYDKTVRFGAKVFPATDSACFAANWDMKTIAENGMGGRISHMLGTRAMTGQTVEIDKKDGVVRVGAPLRGKEFSLYNLKGTIDRRPAMFLLDTGAPVSFVPPKGKWSSKPSRVLRDFFPPIGWFESPVHRLTAEVLGETLEMDFADLPVGGGFGTALTGGCVSGILGSLDLLQKGRLGLDLAKGIVAYERF